MAVDTRVGQTIKHHDEEYKVIGTRPIRHDGLEKVTGEARYGADINLPGQLHGKVLRSPHAHARIVSIDTSRAEALDGVRAVITSAAFPDPGDKLTGGGEAPGLPLKFKSANMLARGKVHYHGHAIAAVAAANPHVAAEALKLIDVEYDPSKVTYEQLLDIFWENHDPTTLNRQGPDFGSQYRSAVFYHDPLQETAARESKEKRNASGRYPRPIVTEITTASTFYRAEEYHQQYLEKRGLAHCRI